MEPSPKSLSRTFPRAQIKFCKNEPTGGPILWSYYVSYQYNGDHNGKGYMKTMIAASIAA